MRQGKSSRCPRALVGILGFGSGVVGRGVRFVASFLGVGVAGWGGGDDGSAGLAQRPRWGRSGERERWLWLVPDGEREREERWWELGVAGEGGPEEVSDSELELEGERGGGVDGCGACGGCEGWTWGLGGVEECELLRGVLLLPRSWSEPSWRTVTVLRLARLQNCFSVWVWPQGCFQV